MDLFWYIVLEGRQYSGGVVLDVYTLTMDSLGDRFDSRVKGFGMIGMLSWRGGIMGGYFVHCDDRWFTMM
jgi:hypothetical protein